MRQGIVCFRTVRQIHRVRRVQNHENWDLQKNGSEDEIGVRSLFLTKLQLLCYNDATEKRPFLHCYIKELFGMINCSYKDVIEGLNCGTIKRIRFFVNDYARYQNCIITRTENAIYNGNTVIRIDVSLTKDSSEKISFLNKFKEDAKLFHLGSKGHYTLKQIWPQISIVEIVN